MRLYDMSLGSVFAAAFCIGSAVACGSASDLDDANELVSSASQAMRGGGDGGTDQPTEAGEAEDGVAAEASQCKDAPPPAGYQACCVAASSVADAIADQAGPAPTEVAQNAYWQSEFEKLGLTYLTRTEDAPGTPPTVLSKEQLARRILMNIRRKQKLEKFEVYVRQEIERRAALDDAPSEGSQPSVLESVMEIIDEALIDTARDVVRCDLYRDEIRGAGSGLRTRQPIAAGTLIGEFSGEIFAFSTEEDRHASDMYCALAFSEHPIRNETTGDRSLVISPRYAGNEFRFANSSTSANCNTRLRLWWAKCPMGSAASGESTVGCRVMAQVFAARPMAAGEQLVCYYGDAYLKRVAAMLKSEGKKLVSFCGNCSEPIEGTRYKCLLDSECTIRFCGKSCMIASASFHPRDVCYRRGNDACPKSTDTAAAHAARNKDMDVLHKAFTIW